MPLRLYHAALALAAIAPLLGGCATTGGGAQPLAYADAAAPAPGDPQLRTMIARYAAHYRVPEALVHAVVRRESGYNPAARNGAYWGLMQISVPTARTMGFRGAPSDLLDADINLRYAVKYLAGAYLVAGHNPRRAIALYQRGYYYDAKRQGLLVATGLASL